MKSTDDEVQYVGPSPDHKEALLVDSTEQSSQHVSATENGSYDAPVKPVRPASSLTAWKIEILCYIISLCFFVAIVVVLRYFDNRPLPKLQFGITPNAVVNALTTGFELFLLVPVNGAIGQVKWLQALHKKPLDNFRAFDEASRGPWGSALLLVQRRGG